MPTAEKKITTRETILDAAERALGRHGYRKLTVQDIADEGNLSKRTIYLYFESKSQAVLALLDRMLSQSLADMERVLEQETSGREKLLQILIVRLTSRIDRCVDYHHTLNESCRAVYPGKVEDFHNLALPDIERVESALKEGVSDGSLRRCSTREVATLLVRGTNGFLPSALSTFDMSDLPKLRQDIESFCTVLVNGLSSEIR